jgi:Ca2+-binding EF-hand superfamily protein
MTRRRAKIASQDHEDEDWDWIAARRAKTSAARVDDSEDDDGGEGLLARTSTTEMQALFSAMDSDKSGKVTFDNVKDLMRGAGEEMTEADLTEMFQYADITGDGMVSYEEFERVIHLHEAEHQTMRELFDALDVSGTGVLTADDLTAFLTMNGAYTSTKQPSRTYSSLSKH